MHTDGKTHFIFAVDFIKLNFSKDEPLIIWIKIERLKKRENLVLFVFATDQHLYLISFLCFLIMCEPFKIICNIMALKLSG